MARPSSAGGGTVFVTVGTTKFDALIRACDQQALADALVERGYGRLVMQVGCRGWAGGCVVECMRRACFAGMKGGRSQAQ